MIVAGLLAAYAVLVAFPIAMFVLGRRHHLAGEAKLREAVKERENAQQEYRNATTLLFEARALNDEAMRALGNKVIAKAGIR